MSPAEEKALEEAAVAAELAGEVVARARREGIDPRAALFAEVAAEMREGLGSYAALRSVRAKIYETDAWEHARLASDERAAIERSLLVAIAATALSAVVTLDAEARR